MKTNHLRGASATLAILFLSACTYTSHQRSWSDIEYPTRSVQLEIVNTAGMNTAEAQATKEVITKALRDLRINAGPNADRKLIVEVVRYNEQPAAESALKWICEFVVPGGWAHRTSNAFDLRARLIMPDGRVVEFAKLAEISEKAREFSDIQENMASRIAYFVFTDDIHDKLQECGNLISTNK